MADSSHLILTTTERSGGQPSIGDEVQPVARVSLRFVIV
jgi:hypothetical protein